MKIERLIGIITILLQKDKVTAPELAKRFEVSRRTINRDIEDICKAGIPLITTQGFGGGISIADGYKIDKSVLTQDELQTIFTGLKGIDSVSANSYLSKLTDKLSDKGSNLITEDFIIIDLASHYQSALTSKIEIIKNAVKNKHVIAFMYYYKKGDSPRKIEPYRLLFKWSSWYIFGFCLERKAFRLFKLNRIWDLKELKEEFLLRNIPPEELELEDYFTSNKIHLKAVFSESEKYRLIDEYGIDCFINTNDNKLLFEFDFSSYENMREWIFSFGDKVHILEPHNLIIDRKNQAENILNDKDG